MSERIGRYITVNGIETYYEESGTGQPIVCLAMAGASGSQYSHLLKTNGSDRFRYIAPDLPGRGKTLPDIHSLKPINDAEEYLEFIWSFVTALGLKHPILLGTAMTATAVLMLANRHSGEVKAVIACNGGVVPKAANDPEYISLLNHPAVNVSDFKECHIPGLCGPDIPRENISTCIWYGAKTQVADTAVADVKVFSRLTIEGELDHVTMPVLLLNGGADITISRGARAKIEALPQCQSRTIPGAGHYMTMEKPEEVAKAVAQFVSSLE